jgi:hypothetical protein
MMVFEKIMQRVGADLCVCPGPWMRRSGADTQVCPYAEHHGCIIFSKTIIGLI